MAQNTLCVGLFAAGYWH